MDFSQFDETVGGLYGTKGSLITILQKAQERFGYLSEETVKHIAVKTGVRPAKIMGVVSFYTQFRTEPIGKNLIMLCRGTACHVNSSAAIEQSLCEYLDIPEGGTTKDGKFTLNAVACLGCCSLSPVMMIETEDGAETYGSLTPAKALNIIKKIEAKNE